MAGRAAWRRIRQFKLAKKELEHFAATPPMELDSVIAQGASVLHDVEGWFRVSLVIITLEKGKFNWSKARRKFCWAMQHIQ